MAQNAKVTQNNNRIVIIIVHFQYDWIDILSLKIGHMNAEENSN